MAQVQHEIQDVDPMTQAFILDRQTFWHSFTGFATKVAAGLVVFLILLWWFVV